jgi:SAM-dependent methyltransferase
MWITTTWNRTQRQYWDPLADVYDDLYRDRWSSLEDNQTGGRLCRVVENGRKVLDLACGTGLACRLLALGDIADCEYYGVDISEEMLRRFSCALEPVALHAADALEFLHHQHESTFDVVSCLYGSMSFLEDAEAAVAEVHRVLRPGGSAYLSFLNRQSVTNLVRNRGRSTGPYPTRHTAIERGATMARMYSRGDLVRIFAKVFQSSPFIRGSSIFAGWLELPSIWTLDRILTSQAPTLAHSLEISCRKHGGHE